MYIKIGKTGDLGKLLDQAFEKINSDLRALVEPNDRPMPFAFAVVEHRSKYSQVYIADEGNLYLPDLWKEGVCMANGSTTDIIELVRAIDYWLLNDISTQQLSERYEFMIPNKHAVIFEQGNEVSYFWQRILNDPHLENIKPIVALALKDEVLSKLFPYTSLDHLCLSRCTGYPYTYDTPSVASCDGKTFEVRLPDNVLAGTGNAMEALALVKKYLPPNTGPAVKGTADDL